jgi:hypothetical protein
VARTIYGATSAPHIMTYNHPDNHELEGPPLSLSIYPLSDLALPFDFGHKVFTTKRLFTAVLKALEDPIEGGCRPKEVFNLLTRIIELADTLLPTEKSDQKSFFADYGERDSLEVVVCVVMPAAITVLATPMEAALLAEYAAVEGQ